MAVTWRERALPTAPPLRRGMIGAPLFGDHGNVGRRTLVRRHRMAAADTAPVTPVCPTCEGELRPVSQAAYGGPRLRAELHLFECPQHGHVFLTREAIPASDVDEGDSPGSDSPAGPAPRHPPAAPSAGTGAGPQPDEH